VKRSRTFVLNLKMEDKTMKQKDEIPASVRCIIPFAGWIDRHPVITNIILIAGAIALFWMVLTYDFTTAP